jgi:hypothetical protein
MVNRELGREMPIMSSMNVVSALNHSLYFHAFAGADTWTYNGWLITAVVSVDEDSVSVIARRGNEQGNLRLSHEELLFFVPNDQTRHNGF